MNTMTEDTETIEKIKTISEQVKESEKILTDKGYKFQGMLIVDYSAPVQCWVKKYTYCRDTIREYREINANGYID